MLQGKSGKLGLKSSKTSQVPSGHHQPPQDGRAAWHKVQPLCHKYARSTESLVRRSSQSHCPCTMFHVHLVWTWGVQLLSPCPHLSALKTRNQRKCTLLIAFLSLLTLMRWCPREKPNLWEQVRAAAGWAKLRGYWLLGQLLLHRHLPPIWEASLWIVLVTGLV